MHKGRNLFVVLMTIAALLLASCASNPETPKPENPPVTTTTTTVAAPTPEQPPVTPVTTVAVAPPEAPKPSVSEVELRNLFGWANLVRSDAQKLQLDELVPEEFASAETAFAKAKTAYDKALDAALFDGVAAYPVKGLLEESITQWEAVIAKGLPLRSDAEQEKAQDMRFMAMQVDAPTLAEERFQGAEELLGQADAFARVEDFELAIPAYKQAAAAFDVSAEMAKANAYKQKIEANDYARFNPNYFEMAENKYKMEADYWDSGSLEDLVNGADVLREANYYYDYVIKSGAEYRSFEGKDAALAAQARALGIKADVNAPDEYSSAKDILNEGLANQQAGNYESAYLWFRDAVPAFDAAHDAALALQAQNELVIADAAERIKAAKGKSAEAEIDSNPYLAAADESLAKARALFGEKQFNDSIMNANEAVNFAGMSDTFVDKTILEREEEAARILAEAKAAADPAMADARNRIVWANNNNIKADYPAEHKKASSSMTAAEMAYDNERYVPAKTLAEEVSSVLSDDFQAKVLADRKAREAEIAKINELAKAKEVASVALKNAEARMAWANENKIKADYPDEYTAASNAMIASYTAFGTEKYELATQKANEVSEILSDDFKASVQAARDAEKARLEQLAKEKAAADPALADARNRIVWANNNNIKAEYPAEYKQASSAMTAAEMAYNNERYVPAKALAEEVSSVLSDDFQAQVLAERQAKEDEKARLAQLAIDKAAADPAMADARNRIVWANNNNIKADYPAEYKQASSAMTAAEMAYDNERYVPAKALAEEVSGILSDDFMAKVLAKKNAPEQTPQTPPAPPTQQPSQPAQPSEPVKPVVDQTAQLKAAAEQNIAKANDKLAWAVSKNAKNNYPELLAKGSGELDAAKAAFESNDYQGASDKAVAAFNTLSAIAEFAPLPAKYTVRLIPERRDCLWRIAEYPFIYNNPLKWPVLYEANKKTFKDPSNPNLIFPGQVLQIPSIKGEKRDGMWDPKKTYQPLAK